MRRTPKNYPAKFMAQMALAPIREEATIAYLSSRYRVHGTQIRAWKKEALASIEAGFSGKQESQAKDITATPAA